MSHIHPPQERGQATSPALDGPSRFVPLGAEPELTDVERAGMGPSRFQEPEGPEDAPSVLHRLGAAVATLAIVVGIPALLWWLSGPPPIPTSLPTRADLTAPIGVEQLLAIFVAVVWLAWLQFVVCLIVELFSAARGGGIPLPVPFSGPSQRLARLLVGGVLLAGVVGGQVAAVVGATSGGGDRSSTSVSANQTPGSEGSGIRISAEQQQAVDQENAARSIARGGDSADADEMVGKKVYTVKAPVGHYHDNLWDIAERHLGDGRRYKEIYDLNQHRQQPDGQALHLARLIQPGWDLIMPEDAIGVSRLAPPLEDASVVRDVARPASAASSTLDADEAVQSAQSVEAQDGVAAPTAEVRSAPTAAAGQGVSVNQSSAAGQGRPPAGSDQSTVPSAQQLGADVAASPLIAGLATGGIFAAMLLLALAARRARHGGGQPALGDALEVEVGLRVGADVDRVRWLDRSLRGLSDACRQAKVALPPLYAVTVSDDAIELHLTPARQDAPDPWVVQDEGRRWVLPKAAGLIDSSAQSPYPALVCIGRDEEGRDVLIDLEASDGPVQVSGDHQVSAQVAGAIAVQLAVMPWADGVQVSALGLPDQLRTVTGSSLTLLENVDTAVTELESQLMQRTGTDVLSGRMARLESESPRYLVLADEISPGLAARISALTLGGRRPFGAVSVGTLPGAQWRLEVDASGSLDLPLLDLHLTAHRLVESQLDAVTALFAAAEQGAPTGSDSRVPVPAAPHGVDDGSYAAAPVSVGIIGSLSVRASGPIDPSRIPLAEEIVVFLACHRGGVHPGVLAGAVWPRGVTHAVASATVQRVRDWLGSDPDGSARLLEDESGRLSLSSSVVVDWDAICSLLERSRNSRSEVQEAEQLRRALRLARGPLLVDRPQGRYAWLARTSLERAVPAVVTDAALRLANLAGSTDPDDAVASLEAGLVVDAISQRLWRELLQVESDRGGASAVHEAVRRLRDTLDDAGVEVEPETDALVVHLLGSSAQHA